MFLLLCLRQLFIGSGTVTGVAKAGTQWLPDETNDEIGPLSSSPRSGAQVHNGGQP